MTISTKVFFTYYIIKQTIRDTDNDSSIYSLQKSLAIEDGGQGPVLHEGDVVVYKTFNYETAYSELHSFLCNE